MTEKGLTCLQLKITIKDKKFRPRKEGVVEAKSALRLDGDQVALSERLQQIIFTETLEDCRCVNDVIKKKKKVSGSCSKLYGFSFAIKLTICLNAAKAN